MRSPLVVHFDNEHPRAGVETRLEGIGRPLRGSQF